MAARRGAGGLQESDIGETGIGTREALNAEWQRGPRQMPRPPLPSTIDSRFPFPVPYGAVALTSLNAVVSDWPEESITATGCAGSVVKDTPDGAITSTEYAPAAWKG